jgi:siroheme synthase-like protein
MQLASTSFTPEPVAVVGNGPDALKAVRLLRAAGANVRWYSHDIDVAEEALLASSPPGWLELSFADPLDGFGDAVAVVSADDGPLDDAVAARARSANIPVHVVDRPEISTVQLFTEKKRRSAWLTGPIGQDWKGFRARRDGSEQRAAS